MSFSRYWPSNKGKINISSCFFQFGLIFLSSESTHLSGNLWERSTDAGWWKPTLFKSDERLMDFLFQCSEFLPCLFCQSGQLPLGFTGRASYQAPISSKLEHPFTLIQCACTKCSPHSSGVFSALWPGVQTEPSRHIWVAGGMLKEERIRWMTALFLCRNRNNGFWKTMLIYAS